MQKEEQILEECVIHILFLRGTIRIISDNSESFVRDALRLEKFYSFTLLYNIDHDYSFMVI